MSQKANGRCLNYTVHIYLHYTFVSYHQNKPRHLLAPTHAINYPDHQLPMTKYTRHSISRVQNLQQHNININNHTY